MAQQYSQRQLSIEKCRQDQRRHVRELSKNLSARMKKSEEHKLHRQTSDEHQLMVRQERDRLKSQELVKAKIDTAVDERYRKSQIINKLILVDSQHKCKWFQS